MQGFDVTLTIPLSETGAGLVALLYGTAVREGEVTGADVARRMQAEFALQRAVDNRFRRW